MNSLIYHFSIFYFSIPAYFLKLYLINGAIGYSYRDDHGDKEYENSYNYDYSYGLEYENSYSYDHSYGLEDSYGLEYENSYSYDHSYGLEDDEKIHNIGEWRLAIYNNASYQLGFSRSEGTKSWYLNGAHDFEDFPKMILFPGNTMIFTKQDGLRANFRAALSVNDRDSVDITFDAELQGDREMTSSMTYHSPGSSVMVSKFFLSRSITLCFLSFL